MIKSRPGTNAIKLSERKKKESFKGLIKKNSEWEG
jgi:hypothetical protein